MHVIVRQSWSGVVWEARDTILPHTKRTMCTAELHASDIPPTPARNTPGYAMPTSVSNWFSQSESQSKRVGGVGVGVPGCVARDVVDAWSSAVYDML